MIVDAIGKKKGIAMFRKHEDQVRVVNYSKRHITVKVQDELQKVEWLLSSYGKAKASKRYIAWQIFQKLKPNHMVPWLLIGDQFLTNYGVLQLNRLGTSW